MPIDARIALGVNQFNLADILKNVEAIKGAAQERAYRGHMMRRQDEADARDADFRSAAADYLTGGGAPAPPPPMAAPGDEPGAPPPPLSASLSPDMSRASPAPYGGGADTLAPLPDAAPQSGSLVSTLGQAGVIRPPGASGAPDAANGSPRNAAFRRMVLADPKEALAARDDHLKGIDAQLDLIGRLAGSAYDQPSYDRARQRAAEMGLDVSSLPQQFSPELAKQVLNEAVSGKDRIAAERAQLKLQWDMQDDTADNERADENLQSLEDYRSGQLSNTRRGQNMTDSRGRRGQDMTDHRVRGGHGAGGGPKSEGAVYADIMSRWTQGGTPNAREREFVRSYETRHTPRGRGRRGRMGGGDGGGLAGQMGAPQPANAPVHVNSVAEARALPPGTMFVAPDGTVRRR